MCLAVPGKVLEIEGTLAKVDFGHGTIRETDISLVDVDVGQYVLVHTGYAIQIMDEEEARTSLSLWKDILKRLGGE
jgi:hydrogenase expression/formation protein HypC